MKQEYESKGGVLHPGEKAPPYLAVMTIVKQGSDIIHEFIVRNFLAGVDHFYIYDGNNANKESGEDLRKILKEVREIVSVLDVPKSEDLLRQIGREGEFGINGSRETQMRVNWMCFLTHCKHATWVAVIDVDEFFEMKDPREFYGGMFEGDGKDGGGEMREEWWGRQMFMRDVLKKYEDVQPAVATRWRMVMSNGRIYSTDRSLTLNEAYPFSCSNKTDYRDDDPVGVTNYAKIIVQPKYLDFDKYKETGLFFLHGLSHLKPVYQEMHHIEPYRDFVLHANTTSVEFYLLHYWSRSFEDFLLKAQRGIQPPILTEQGAEKGLIGQPESRFIWEFFWREAGCRKAKHPPLHRDPSAEKRVWLVKKLMNEMRSYKWKIKWKKRLRRSAAVSARDGKYPKASAFAARVANQTASRTICDDPPSRNFVCPYPFEWSTPFFNESTEQRLFR